MTHGKGKRSRSETKRGKRSDKKRRETLDGKTGKPDPTPRRIDLSSLRDVRLEMAEVYRRVDRQDLESQDGSRRVFMLRQIADVIINTELERRVAELEQQAAHSPQGGRPLLPSEPRTLN